MKVILVEDERLVAKVLSQRILPSCGYGDVEVFENASEAIQAISSADTDLVITDLGLVDGTEAGEGVVEACKQEDVPVILLSGSAKAKKIGEEHGIIFISKPFDVHALRTAIEKVTRIG